MVLYKGLGNWQHPIATRSAEAQKFFDQGLALLYGFNRYEALRSFRKASELDASAAMPWWGMAMATGPYINMGAEGDGDLDSKAACQAVETGLKIAGAPPRERAYLEAAATRCPEYKGGSVRRRHEVAGRALSRRSGRGHAVCGKPDGAGALALVRQRWQAGGRHAGSGAHLEQVLRRWPEHPGANHYYIHAVESSPTPERAVPSAQRLMGVVPWAGHMVHMPAHIWLVLGDYELAATVNQRAGQVDREYFAASNVTGVYNMYYVHNLHFVAYARSMQGHRAETLSRRRKRWRKRFCRRWTSCLRWRTRFSLWRCSRRYECKRGMRSSKCRSRRRSSFGLTAIWRYARALALLAQGDRAGAARERDAFETARKKIPAERPWGTLNSSGDVMALAAELMAARFAATPAEAVPHWRRRSVCRTHWFTTSRRPGITRCANRWARRSLRAGRGADAEKVFREGLKRSPRNGWMLFGLMESLKAQGKRKG